MKTMLIAALLLGTAPAAALAQTATTPNPSKDAATVTLTQPDTGHVTIVYDKAWSEEFEVDRAIVDRVKEVYGEAAVYDNGQDLPGGLEDEIAPGNILPAEVEVGEVPAQLGDLPTLGEGTRWVTVGEHLVEIGPDNTIVMVVYDALP